MQLKVVRFMSRCACGFAAAIGILFGGSPARAAISLTDAGQVWTDNTGVQPITNDFTISPAADVLVVELGWRQQGNGDVPTVTYNGEPLTMAVDQATNSNSQNSAIFYLASNQLGWATGSSDPLSVNFGVDSSGFTESDGCIDAFTLGGVDLTKLPGSSLANSTAGVHLEGTTNPSISLTVSNITPGSWVAYTTSYRTNNTTLPLLTAWTTGTGSLAGGQSTSGNGNQWGAQTTNTIEAGALVENVQSPTFTLSESNGTPANTHWAMAAAVFQAAISPLTWTGAAGSGGFASWNTTDINWVDPSANPSAYSDLDPVTFPDAVANANITIAGSVAPGAINFTNATTVYSFSGGAITGGASVTLSGGGLVILNNANSYFGPTTINSGTLQLGQTNAVGSSPVTVNAAGGLAFGSGVGTFNVAGLFGSGGFSLTDAASNPVNLVINGNGAYSVFSGNISGAGSLTVASGVFGAATPVSVPSLATVSVSSGATLVIGVGGASDWSASVDALRGAAAFAPGSLLGFDTTNGNFTYGGNFTSGVGVAKYGNNMLSLTGNIDFAGSTVFTSASNAYSYISGIGVATVSGGTVQLSGVVNLANIGGGATNIYYTSGNTAYGAGSATNVFTNVSSGSTYTTYGGPGTTLIISGGTTTLSGVNTYAGITWDGSNHCVMTPTIVDAGAVLSFSSGASLPQVPANYPYQDTRSLQLNGGTLLYTGTSTTDSTLLNFGGNNANNTIDIQNAGANFTLGWGINSVYFNKTGLGTLTLGGPYFGNNGSGFSVLQGTLVMNAAGYTNQATSGVSAVSPGATLQMGTSAGPGQDYVGVSNMNGTFDLNGMTFADCNGFSGAGTITNSRAATTGLFVYGWNPDHSGSYNGTFAGNIADGAGAVALTVSNNSTLTLTGTGNAYSGGTLIGDTSMLIIGDGSSSPGSLSGNVFIASTTAGALTFNTPAGMSITASGNISGSGGAVSVSGAGLVTLSGSNSYTGPTTVNGGTLQIGNGGSGEGLLSSITMSNNATLAFNHADPLSYGGAISGSGQLVKLGVGVLDISGTSTYSGPTTISAGTVELDGNGNNLPLATALTIASSGVLDMAGVPQTVGSLSGSAGAVVTNSLSEYPSTLTVAPSSGSTTFAGNIFSNVALALSGSGQLTLSGTNAYTGGTTVSGGTLDIAAPSALAGSGLVTIAAGGRLVLGSGAGIGALLAASSPASSDAVALSAASAPATVGGYENTSGSMATLGGAPPLSQGGGGSAVGGSAAAVPEPGTIALLVAGTIGLLGYAWRRRRAT